MTDNWAKDVGEPARWVGIAGPPTKKLHPLLETETGDYYTSLTGQVYYRDVEGRWQVASVPSPRDTHWPPGVNKCL